MISKFFIERPIFANVIAIVIVILLILIRLSPTPILRGPLFAIQRSTIFRVDGR